jgi:hypothetical protein
MFDIAGLAGSPPQNNDIEVGVILAAILFVLVIVIVVYVVMAWLLYRIGKRLGYEHCWFAWVPFANIWMMCELSGRAQPAVWFSGIVLMTLGSNLARSFAPESARVVISMAASVAGIVIYVLLWMGICERCGKPSWWAILWIIPIVGWVIMYKLGESEPLTAAVPQGQYYPPGYYPPPGYPVPPPGYYPPPAEGQPPMPPPPQPPAEGQP